MLNGAHWLRSMPRQSCQVVQCQQEELKVGAFMVCLTMEAMLCLPVVSQVVIAMHESQQRAF